MSDSRKLLLVIKAEQILKPEQRAALFPQASALAERLGAEVMIADGGLDAGLHSDIAPLVQRQIELQQETNQLLEALVMALAEDADPDAPPLTYMDGAPIGQRRREKTMAGNGNSGRPGKPAVVHLIKGNPSKKNAQALLDEALNPPVPAEAPDKPDHLNEEAAQIWDGLIPDLLKLGLVTRLDGHTLAEYCHCLSKVRALDRMMDELNETSANGVRGYFQTSRTGYRSVSEVMQARAMFNSRVDAIGRQFGFSPLARRGLRVEAPQGELFPNEQKQIADKYF